jgi:hypothetical protein
MSHLFFADTSFEGVALARLWLSIASMRSPLRATLAVLAVAGGLLACSRSASTESTKSVFPKAESNPIAWQVKCDVLCDVKAKAATLDALCKQTTAAVKGSACTSRRAAGFPQLPASAVTDAAILEVAHSGKVERTAFLAINTVSGWQLARPLGTGSSIKTVSASPVDLPGLAPAGVQIQVALADETSTHERLFVCGLSGEGQTQCPVAIEVSGSSSSFAQMAAKAGDAVGGEWRVAVEVTPKGYVAKKVAGSVPDGLAGEHSFDVQ